MLLLDPRTRSLTVSSEKTSSATIHVPKEHLNATTEHTWAVDGLEEGMARIEEDGERILTVPRYLLPPDAREGHLLRVRRVAGKREESLTVTIEIDREATAAALAKSKARTHSASAASRKRDPGGNVSL